MTILVLETLGGLGLFLLAMSMLTDGLKAMAGTGLRNMLKKGTRSNLRGASLGALITAIVQSSSAVTVATIGFVNAGILAMPQALSIVFGANLGTTMTGWLVSLTGFDFRIEALALPLVALGTAFHMLAGRSRFQGLGTALIGFGLFFLGLSILKDSFAGFGSQLDLAAFGSGDVRGIVIMLGIGFAVTAITQSSSASIALIITAASQGALSLPVAAAAIIGANLGTTSTAFLASIGATSAARRVAAGHIVFNGITASLALAILPLLILMVRHAGDFLGLEESAAATLALFHSFFNLLGIIVLLPFTNRIARFLNRFFKTAEDDVSRPKYLDNTLISMPVLALDALYQEVSRMHLLAAKLALAAFTPGSQKPAGIVGMAHAVTTLGDNISYYTTEISTNSMSRASALEFPLVLRTTRYLAETANLAPSASQLQHFMDELGDPHAKMALRTVLQSGHFCVSLSAQKAVSDPLELDQALSRFQGDYAAAKSALLISGSNRTIDIAKLDLLLNDLRQMRRMVEQITKAARTLRDMLARASAQSQDHGKEPKNAGTTPDGTRELSPMPASGLTPK
ncbi:Na/Pi cotransporter [Iodidimonas muriae]|uniref:Na/Pi cotransporter n=1 Tax=Iodidimonas muriae TaxID=261467 RepID=A0ABQ2LHP2_9PROT|nr:Na/Pi cotransporter family protein [Iodidimonas muriae]GER08629.1 Na/Pi cotransporter [Kordiimonadales bacterium JCM 17843]GGO15757.1 Na/Pi cotransporter [Iodidimonas muriae]